MNRAAIPPETRHVPEPEILAPGQPERVTRSGATWTRLRLDGDGVHRVSVTRIGPLGMLGFWMMIALGALALVILFLGALVLLIPAVALVLATGLVMRLLRTSSRRWF